MKLWLPDTNALIARVFLGGGPPWIGMKDRRAAFRSTPAGGLAIRRRLATCPTWFSRVWPNHVHHREAQGWFAKKGAAQFRTCPITQTGFVRISSNPAFSSEAATPGEALALLDHVQRLPGHDFWPDDLSAGDAFAGKSLIGHRQVTDAYLLALAIAHGGVLATLDRAVAVLGRRNPGAVEIIG